MSQARYTVTLEPPTIAVGMLKPDPYSSRKDAR